LVDFQTAVVIILVAAIDVLAFFEYYNLKIQLDEARKKASQQASQPQPSTPVQRIKQTIQKPLIITESASSQTYTPPVKNTEVENLKDENAKLQKKNDFASSRTQNTIQTSLNEVGSKIDGVLSQVQSVKGKLNPSQTA
jgi:FtsZ-binding cell division protein ZapB